MNLNIQHIRGQCYDGSTTMAGKKTGVATQIKRYRKYLYTHCYTKVNVGRLIQFKVLDTVSRALYYTFRELKHGKL